MKIRSGSPDFSRYLTDIPPFANLTEEQGRDLRNCAEIVGCDAGEVLFREGDPAEAFFFLRAGRVKMRKISPSGHEIVLHLASPPNMIGCKSLTLPGSRYPADAVAVDAVVALRFTRARFLEAVAHTPDVFLGLLVEMNRRLIEIYSLHSAMLEPVEQRIARLLLNQALPKDVSLDDWKRHPITEIRITKQLIAAIVGATTETAIRILSRWKKRGVIDSERGKIWIRDQEAVYRLAMGSANRKAV